MIITPKQPRDNKTVSRLSKLVPYMLRGKGEERCTWYMAGNLEGLDRQQDAGLAVDVMELLQEGNTRAKGNKTYHLVISFHPEDRRLAPAELEGVVRRAVGAAGLEEHQYIAVRHSEQEHEHLHVAVNKIHPETLKIHHPYKAIHAYQAVPPQNPVDGAIVGVSVLGVKLAYPDASLAVRPARNRQIELEFAPRTRSGEPCLATAAGHCAAQDQAPQADQSGSCILGRAVAPVARLAERPPRREAPDRDRLASQGL